MLSVVELVRAEVSAAGMDDDTEITEGAQRQPARTPTVERPIPTRPDLVVDNRWAVEVEGDDVEVGTITDLYAWVNRYNGIAGGAPGPNG